jgi:hypothetical protein
VRGKIPIMIFIHVLNMMIIEMLGAIFIFEIIKAAEKPSRSLGIVFLFYCSYQVHKSKFVRQRMVLEVRFGMLY